MPPRYLLGPEWKEGDWEATSRAYKISLYLIWALVGIELGLLVISMTVAIFNGFVILVLFIGRVLLKKAKRDEPQKEFNEKRQEKGTEGECKPLLMEDSG
ncbi:uncharacterized protein Bfra_009667 [Botrytis fragariae]|uniref:Uncharacterized protein n=1 Tax=Botrytis fragariae TaxID=1964551 RepID=A0A8H6EFC2_9HELO|nr:uncharacterized protein Bfra_009667 [Botrytis fragariae]KAF5870284.1 hypothetical protein Bfra_009667 [Botrytis fragariae]